MTRSNLLPRLLSALILAPLILWIVVEGGVILKGFLALIVALMVREWIRMNFGKDHQNARLVGIGVIFLLAYLFYWLRSQPDGMYLTLYLVLVCWVMDIFAYFGGTLIKGPLLLPRISPRKTWAGFVSGIVGAVGLTVVFYVFGHPVLESLTLLIIAGIIMALLGPAGDLLISYFKRKSKVKDSGGIIPGHGGVLDRVDSFVLNLPFWCLITYVG